MADKAWVRKYRPSSFTDYMGDNVKSLIVNRFRDRNSIPNTTMLYGPRGTGKTSMARLMCKEIHCMNPIDGHSCGECEMCKEIDNYITSAEAGIECMGILEIDGATTTGKVDINDIIDEALEPPLYPLKYKVIILDECHKISKAAQNSLLKVIEEPPEHLIFILCTTEPEGVINTIHSRMQLKIEVHRKSIEEMTNKLLEIAKSENLETSKEALEIIAKKGERIPRECINLLENIAKNYGNSVTVDTVRKALGAADKEIYGEFFEAANTSLEHILNFNKKLKVNGTDIKKFMTGLIEYTLDACYIVHGISLEEYPIDVVEQVKKLFKHYKNDELSVLLEIIESASYKIENDDTKNELYLTTTAIRIGKIGLLANGLATIEKDTEKENTISISEYRKRIEEEKADQFKSVKEVGVSQNNLSNIFKNMSTVEMTAEIERDFGNIKEEKGQQDNNIVAKDMLMKLLDED